MALDLKKIKAKKKEVLQIDPVEIFQGNAVSDPSINDLWLAQGDALREWHKHRDSSDVGVVLNTGAGKTLVGLLIAKSLVNETRGRVLYACSSIQLVEQTVNKAKGYGLPITSYYQKKYSNDLFQRGEAPCITTYQALLNGHSVFSRNAVDAVIFDDAHAAEHLLRDHFSLRIDKSVRPDLFLTIHALFKTYHQQVGMEASYEELISSDSSRLFFVPPFELHRQNQELLRILVGAKFNDDPNATFAWAHLKDHTDLCCVLINESSIIITPPYVPTTTLPYFNAGVRRVYLSATLSAPDAFVRTYGKEPDEIIAPTTSAGECERLILFPSRLENGQEDIEVTKELLAEKKTLAMVPTYGRASRWADFAVPPEKNNVSAQVEAFKTQTGSPKLLLAARYDGMDLPGDTCRIMVIDDLPMGVGPLERFLWEYLDLSSTFRSTIASRIVQSFGRISRGMSDHGVVFITGNRLVDWLLTPRNMELLPPFLQKQIELGFAVSDQSKSLDDYSTVIEQSLSRDEVWLETYKGFMDEAEYYEADEEKAELAFEIASSEASFARFMWARDYENAAKSLSSTLEKAFSFSASTGAWHSLWLGRAQQLMGDNAAAREMFVRAHSVNRNIPPVPTKIDLEGKSEHSSQIIEVSRQLSLEADGTGSLPKKLHTDLAALDGTGSSGQTEESLRALGQYFGLEATRPDKESGTGPDVLWLSPGLPALCIEVKTNKKADSLYKKDEVGQLNDHMQWVLDNTEAEEIIPVFVGPIKGATDTTNPPASHLVTSLDQFQGLAEMLKAALADIVANSLPLTLRNTIQDTFEERGLEWPNCLKHIQLHTLKDL